MKKIIAMLLSVFLLSCFVGNLAFAAGPDNNTENKTYTYFKYETSTNEGKSVLWCVLDRKTGDFDPGYKTEEGVKAASMDYNGYAKKGEDATIVLPEDAKELLRDTGAYCKKT